MMRRGKTRSDERRIDLETLPSLASNSAQIDDAVAQRAHDLCSAGYGLYAALHLAAAESAGVDVLLSTDDRFVRRAARGEGRPRISALNPVSWIQEAGR